MTFPLVLDLAADGIPVAVTCGLLGFSRQAFYSWRAHPVSERDMVDAYATNAALEVHLTTRGSGTGSSPTSSPTPATTCPSGGCGRCAPRPGSSPRTPASGRGPRSRARRCTTTSSSGTSLRPAPNRLWLTDITEHPTAQGKLYLCAVKDVWSRRIVGYSIDSRMTSHLAVDALEMAIARRGRDQVPGCVVHADRGSQGGFNRSSQHRLVGASVGAR